MGYLYEKLVSIVLRKAFEISRTCWCWLDRKKKFARLLHSALCFNFDHELKQEEAVGEKTKELSLVATLVRRPMQGRIQDFF